MFYYKESTRDSIVYYEIPWAKNKNSAASITFAYIGQRKTIPRITQDILNEGEYTFDINQYAKNETEKHIELLRIDDFDKDTGLCHQCRFFSQKEGDKRPGYGNCKKHAPFCLEGKTTYPQVTYHNTCCGDFESK